MLTKTIPSYLYQTYADDSDLQAFVRSYNEMTQEYVDFFNTLNLGAYVGANHISGSFLDWVALGLFGKRRPVLSQSHGVVTGPSNVGVFNSVPFNTLVLNKFYSKTVSPVVYYTVNDDVFKRILTWHFYKGDGRVFNTRWLKRRILRFVNGENGTDIPSGQGTNGIGVYFAGESRVIIRFGGSQVNMIGGTFNTNTFNKSTFNSAKFTVVQHASNPMAPVFKSAVDAGVLELPFQYSFPVIV